MEDCRKIVAYFDFDGTISNRDTFVPFLIFTVGSWSFFRKLPKLLPILFKYLCRIINNSQAKEATLKVVLKNYKFPFVDHKAKSFALTRLNKYIKPAIYAKLEWHREHHHTLILVSANLGIYLRYWAQLHKIDYVIATEVEFDENQRINGCLATPNCYAEEKVLRIEKCLLDKQLNFCYSYGYGNSAGDYAMLNYVSEAYLVKGDYIQKYGVKE